ncbi:uncharacterized protein LOC127706739 [Mytilus californianus]|uniref:uncharacterized protein LOC127706739 n=1 Tax=Mytilus californianus TaxID=6549 RepID=UPI0022486F32|nr:uncharacterized protein LOC127706739 [Mytilus californianus]
MSLKIEEELNDQIINLYCSVLQKRTDQCVQKVSRADYLILTSIFEGMKSVTWFKKDDIQQYDTVIGCINDGKCHWVAVVMDVQHHIVTIMDPLKISKKLRTYEKNFNYFTKSRDLGTWTICTAVGYPLQNDFSSCGVYCLKFLDRYLSKTDTSLELNVQAERFTIGSEIVQAVQTKGAVMTCFLCAKEPTNMRACSCCKRNFHKKCMTPGLCSLCSIFPPESFRQSKKDKKEEEQESSENVDQSENVRNLKRVKKEEQKSTENEDESGNVRQSKRRKKEQEQSLENVDKREHARKSKRGKKEEKQKSTENVDESGIYAFNHDG